VGKRQYVWSGHALRHESLLRDVVEGRLKSYKRLEKNAPVERPDGKRKLHGSKTRSSRQSRLDS